MLYPNVLYTTAMSLSLYLLHSSSTYVDVPPYIWQVAHINYVFVFNYHTLIPFSFRIVGKSSNGRHTKCSFLYFFSSSSQISLLGQILHLYCMQVSNISITSLCPTALKTMPCVTFVAIKPRLRVYRDVIYLLGDVLISVYPVFF